MFKNSQYNQPLNNWCEDNSHTSNLSTLRLRSFKHMFENSEFNQPLDNWRFEFDHCRMDYMFAGTSKFNQNISSWNVQPIDCSYMFYNNKFFNKPLEWIPIQLAICKNTSHMFLKDQYLINLLICICISN